MTKDVRLRDARRETVELGPVSRVKLFPVFVLLLIFFTSCQTELKLAKKYMAERQGIQAAVYFPEQAEVKVEYNIQYGQQTEVLNGFN